MITFRTNQDGKKQTQKIKEVKVQEKVHPLIAQRKTGRSMVKKRTRHQDQIPVPHSWGKVDLKLGTSWKQDEKKEEEDKAHERAQNCCPNHQM